MKYRKTVWFDPFSRVRKRKRNVSNYMVRFDCIGFGPNFPEEGTMFGVDVAITDDVVPITKETLADCSGEWNKSALAEMRRGVVERGITRTECPEAVHGHPFCFLCDDGEAE